MKKCYVYKITNKLLNKSYIGSRINNDPYEDLYMGSSKYLNEDYIVYGIVNFNKEIIEIYENISKEQLLDNETNYILFFNTLHPHGYNKNFPNKHISWHRAGIPLSENAREKISKGLKLAYKEGRKIVPDYSGEKHPMYGKHHTDEAKEKCGNSFRGKKHKKETKQKMSQAHMGVKKTKEHAKHISEGRKGIIFSDEHKKNISKSKKGKIPQISEEGRKRISEATKKLNKRRIKCSFCNKEFNLGNFSRHHCWD